MGHLEVRIIDALVAEEQEVDVDLARPPAEGGGAAGLL